MPGGVSRSREVSVQEFLDSLSSKYLAMAAGALMSALFSSDLSKLQAPACLRLWPVCGGGLHGSTACLSGAWDRVGKMWVAGGLALSGNNLVKWVLRISKDPGQILARFKGAGK